MGCCNNEKFACLSKKFHWDKTMRNGFLMPPHTIITTTLLRRRLGLNDPPLSTISQNFNSHSHQSEEKCHHHEETDQWSLTSLLRNGANASAMPSPICINNLPIVSPIKFCWAVVEKAWHCLLLCQACGTCSKSEGKQFFNAL